MANCGEERELVLLTGRRFVLRDIVPADAAEIEQLEKDTEGDALLQGEDPGTEAMPLALREKWIREMIASDGCLSLVATCEGKVAGVLELRAPALPKIQSHVGRFFILLRGDARGVGIGRSLMEMMIAWAKANPRIEKVSLSVLSTNEPAIGLYRSLGFEEEGRKLRDFHLPNGHYADDVLMFMKAK